MQNVVIRKAGDMLPPLKAAVEEILGRAISPEEEISVVAVPPRKAVPLEDRTALARKLEAFLDRRAAAPSSAKDPDAALDKEIDEAVNQARHQRG